MSSSRIPSLDGIRALSILLVLASHFGPSLHYSHDLWAVANCYGKVGLRIFYVLSGFLITHLLMRERGRTGAISLKAFYVRRAYRILPAAYLYMVIITLIFHADFQIKDIAFAFTYLSAYSTYIPHNLSHLWSLSVEEQFYLIWPLVMTIAAIRERRVAVGVILLAPIARLVLITGGWNNGPLFPMATSIDALAMGCLLALTQDALGKWSKVFTDRRFWLIWLLTALLPLIELAGHGRMYQVAVVPVLHLGIALCMQNAMVMRHRVLNSAIAIWIGTISYSLYLWHRPFDEASTHSWYAAVPANLLLMLGAALASYYFVEQPMLKLRDRRLRKVSRFDNPADISTASAMTETQIS
jgi:peptidoglycan/LPS O-acetylase OafA/YrhL